jgi:Prolyl oligopeptidase family
VLPAHVRASPLAHIGAGAGGPPFLILHGTHDQDMRPRHSRELARWLAAAGVPVRLVLVHGAVHGLDNPVTRHDVVYFGELYPLRPDVISYLDDMFRPFPGGATSRGGPTLVGAWIVHAMVAAGLQVAGLALIRGLGALCGRITRPLLGE